MPALCPVLESYAPEPLLFHLRPSRRAWWHCGHWLHRAACSPGSATSLFPSLSFCSVVFSVKHSFKVKVSSKKSGRMTQDYFQFPPQMTAPGQPCQEFLVLPGGWQLGYRRFSVCRKKILPFTLPSYLSFRTVYSEEEAATCLLCQSVPGPTATAHSALHRLWEDSRYQGIAN